MQPLARSPCAPSWSAILVSLCVPSQISVDPFSGFMVTSGTFMTSAKGMLGWPKSASVWVGWEAGGESGVGGRAVLPEMKRRDGYGPRVVDVTWVTMGSECYQKGMSFLVAGCVLM